MDIRAVGIDDLPAWLRCVTETFGGDPAGDPLQEERHRALIDPARTFGAFDGDKIVGAAAGFDFRLSVPGGSVPMSGLTMVAVRPSHRRRGILRALIERHLEAARAHGDPVSGLWASEATIYGRFGYGVAAEADELTLAASGASIRDDLGDRDTIELVPREGAGRLMAPVYERVFATRPGLFSRSEAWWSHRRERERPFERNEGSPRRFLVARRDGVATGYVMYRQRLSWTDDMPSGRVMIDELAAVDARAEATLWAFLVGVDLFPKVTWFNAPPDSLLPWLLDNRRRLLRRRSETLWLRIEDVPSALMSRRYAADGALRLAVEGRCYALDVEAGSARCAASDGRPELEMDRATLGSIFLGGFQASYLARAGRVRGDRDALARADRMFASEHAAWCAEIF